MKAIKGNSMVALLVALLLIPFTASAQWQIGQRSFAQAPVTASWSFVQSTGGGCSVGPTCTFAITPTTANSVIIVPVYTATNLTMTSAVLQGCSTPGTFTGGSGSSYQAFGSPPGGTAWGYILGNGGGCTDLLVTMSAADSGNIAPFLLEFSRGGGTPVLDALSTTSSNLNTTSCTTCTGSSFTSLSGTKDLIVQVTNTGSGTSSPSSPYVWDPNQFASYALNSIQLTAPTWTQSSGGFQTFGVAFK